MDTNILLVSIAKQSRLHPIYTSLLRQRYDLLVSTEIYLEYSELLLERSNALNAKRTLRALLVLPNVMLTEPSYRWRLVVADPDDDKFVDCAVAGNADYLITDDKHYERLKNIEFPMLTVLTGDQFLKVLAKA